MALRIIHTAATAIQRTIDIRILGELNSDEQEYFKHFKTISYRKAKKMKNAVLITGFNPILNVDCIGDLSKVFIEIYNPISRLTPVTLQTLFSYWIDKDCFLYDENFAKTEWSKYTDYEDEKKFSETDFSNENLTPSIKEIYNNIDENIPIVHFILSGTTEDFPLYNYILKSSREGNIHIYTIYGGEEEVEFTKLNLGTYIGFRNYPRNCNIVSEEEGRKIIEESNGDINEQIFIYKDFKEEKEETNENSNS